MMLLLGVYEMLWNSHLYGNFYSKINQLQFLIYVESARRNAIGAVKLKILLRHDAAKNVLMSLIFYTFLQGIYSLKLNF